MAIKVEGWGDGWDWGDGFTMGGGGDGRGTVFSIAAFGASTMEVG
jgi:hypothetical protein